MRQWLALVTLLLAIGVVSPALAAKRVALIIGNSQYKHTQKLTNPENDSRLIASILRKQGFEVLEHQNLDFKSMKRAIKAYTSKLEEHGKQTIGLVFYAGHGVQSGGRNYLVPVDAQIAKEGDVEIETISSQALLSGVRIAGNRLNIIILDACRNNPYRGIFRSASRGFTRMDAPIGSLVAFSTAPGTVAADGSGTNSPYTAALARAMVEPGLKIEDVFKRTRATVYAATGGKQVPWESSSIFGEFYFAGKRNAGNKEKANSPMSAAAEAWSVVKDTRTAGDLELFIKRFPKSFYADLARSRLKKQKMAVGVISEESKPVVRPNFDRPESKQQVVPESAETEARRRAGACVIMPNEHACNGRPQCSWNSNYRFCGASQSVVRKNASKPVLNVKPKSVRPVPRQQFVLESLEAKARRRAGACVIMPNEHACNGRPQCSWNSSYGFCGAAQ